MPDRTRLPEPGPIAHFTPPEPTIRWLSNGIRVWHVKLGPTALVTLILVFPRGGATDPSGKGGLTALTADLLDEGAAGLGALQIAARWQELGTDYAVGVDVDATQFVLHLMRDTFEPSVELLADLVRRPALSPAEFDRCRDQRIAQALAQESDPVVARWTVERRVLFGDGYAGDLPRGTRDTLAGLTLEDARGQYPRVFAADGAELVVVGGIDLEEVQGILEKSFGSWRTRGDAEPRPVAAGAGPPGIYMVDFPGAPQSNLSLVRRSEGALGADYFPAQVYQRIFGGSFTSRLNMNLREDKGYTYGAAARFRRYREAGYFVLQASVKTTETRASIDEMLKEIAAPRRGYPLTERERTDAIAGYLLGFPGSFQRVSEVAAGFASLPILGRGPRWYSEWASRMAAVTAVDLDRVARAHGEPSEFSVIVAGNGREVEATLSSLGLPLVHYDARGRSLGVS